MRTHKMKILISVFLFTSCCSFQLQAQKEANVWYFGQNAAVDFNGSTPTTLTGGRLNSFGSCASISNSLGQLQFYTDGVKVWDNTHQVMPNGNNLSGNKTSQILIIPIPDSNHLYYIFYVKSYPMGSDLQYSIVDMKLNGGRGDVRPASKDILLHHSAAEKMSAVLHCNNKDVWLATMKVDSSQFYMYLITENGISAPQKYPAILWNTSSTQMKFSPDGRWLAYTENATPQIYTFDHSTGEVLHYLTIPRTFWLDYYHGVSFSPNSDILYISFYGQDGLGWYTAIYQYDMQSTDILSSVQTLVKTHNVQPYQSGSTWEIIYYMMQNAPDGKIYISKRGILQYNLNDTIAVINNPDIMGPGADFESLGLPINGSGSQIALPTFIESYFNNKAPITPYPTVELGNDTLLCDGATLLLDPQVSGVTYQWSDLSTGSSLLVAAEGIYGVTVTAGLNNCSATDSISINYTEAPQIDLGSDTIICLGDTLSVNASFPYSTYTWQDNSTNSLFEIFQKGEYWVTVINQCGVFSDSISVDATDCDLILLTLPNLITPNHDGSNDEFTPVVIAGVIKMNTTIYNSWGSKIYETNNLSIGWNAADAVDGMYFFSVEYTDIHQEKHILKGWLSVVR